MTDVTRSIHISYERSPHGRLLDALGDLVDYARQQSGGAPLFSVLDVGCGRGELLERLSKKSSYALTGLDMDTLCAEMCRAYADVVVGTVEQIDTLFPARSFDMVILSHVLEHMPAPLTVMQTIATITRRWVLIAVPNPIRFKILIKHGLLRQLYSNKGHYCCWDRSHLQTFLAQHCALHLVRWGYDEVKIIPFRWLRKLLSYGGILEFLEKKVCVYALPFFASSLVVLCETTEP